MKYVNILRKLFIYKKEISYKLPISSRSKALIISPHPDDETLGCAGAIIKMLSLGVNITVVLLSDGASGGKMNDIKKTRRDEFLKAQKVLGYTSEIYFDFPDGKLKQCEKKLEEKLYKVISKEKPDLIFVPYFLDSNLDHISANIVLAKVLNKIKKKETKIAQYEIWTPITYPNCCINITDEYKRKISAIKEYSSQEEYYRIMGKMIALNSLRAELAMYKKFKYMECYKILNIEDYHQAIELLKRLLFNQVRR